MSLPKFENLDQYSQEELSRFTSAEVMVLRVAAFLFRACNLVKSTKC